MKKIIMFFMLVFCLSLTINVYATSSSDNVGTDISFNMCTTKYQDNSMSINATAYFSYCLKAICNNNLRYEVYMYAPEQKITCNNNNKSPYYYTYKNGCSSYENNSCSSVGVTKYCSAMRYYDCNRKADGTSFTTTKKTTKYSGTKVTTAATTVTTTTVVPETTTTTTVPVVPIDTSLASLTISPGTINFNKDTYEYTVNVLATVKTIGVNAVPSDSNSKVDISGNTNIQNGSVIKIVVTGSDGNTSTYSINIAVDGIVQTSNDAYLKSLTIKDHQVAFSKDIYTYDITISGEETNLDISYEVNNEKSEVLISGNENLKNGSTVIINVTAEDGTVKNYEIHITVKAKSNVLSILFIILIIIAVIVGAYYLYKKFIGSKVGEKYEYE